MTNLSDMSLLPSLLKRIQYVTTLEKKPKPPCYDCMCGGNCSTYSDDVYRLWHTYEAIVLKTTTVLPSELVRRLDGVLTYYEEKEMIPWHVVPGWKYYMHFKTKEIKPDLDDPTTAKKYFDMMTRSQNLQNELEKCEVMGGIASNKLEDWPDKNDPSTRRLLPHIYKTNTSNYSSNAPTQVDIKK